MHKLIIRKGEHMMKKLAEILQKGSIVRKKQRGITLIALVVTIVLNCSYLAMERMLKKVKKLKKEETSCII